MSDLAAGEELVAVGRVGRPHGIKGELRLFPYSGDPQSLTHYRQLFLAPAAGGAARAYGVKGCRIHGREALVQLAGIDDRTAAEAFTNAEAWVRKADRPPLAANEIYLQDLVGLTAFTEEGRRLGTVRGLLATGGSDLLVIEGRGREYLVPARREFLVAVEPEAGRLVIRPVPGLLEMND
ncbi:MAG: ribosome maturation factor RimM [Thermodesulfobacteriota bacterium]